MNNTDLFVVVNSFHNPFLDYILPVISKFGTLFWFVFCVILFLLGREKDKEVAILAICALSLTFITTMLLKYVIAEPRPFETLENVRVLTNEEVRHYSSFPSAHASGSFAFAVVVGLKYKMKILGMKLTLIYPLLIFAALIGFSRIYIGLHYPGDVICGAIIGICFAVMVLKLEDKILDIFKTKT